MSTPPTHSDVMHETATAPVASPASPVVLADATANNNNKGNNNNNSSTTTSSSSSSTDTMSRPSTTTKNSTTTSSTSTAPLRKPPLTLQPEALGMPVDDTVTSSSCACSDSVPSLSQRVDDARTPCVATAQSTRASNTTRDRPQRPGTVHARARRGDGSAATPDKLGSPRNATNTNLFIRNLAPQVDQAMLNSLFAEYGTILSSAIMRNIHTGVSLGTGFVRYETHEQARTAMERLCGYQFEGRTITVQWANKHEGAPVGEARQKIHKLFVRNIPLTSTVDNLMEFFSRFGEVKGVSIHKDTTVVPERALERRIAFIIYVEEGVADKAAAAVHNTTPFAACNGIPLMVKLAEDSYNKYERKNAAVAAPGRRGGAGAMAMTGAAAMQPATALTQQQQQQQQQNGNSRYGRYTSGKGEVMAADMAGRSNSNDSASDYCTPSCQMYGYTHDACGRTYNNNNVAGDSSNNNSGSNSSHSGRRSRVDGAAGAATTAAAAMPFAYQAMAPCGLSYNNNNNSVTPHAMSSASVIGNGTSDGGYQHVHVPCYAHTPQASQQQQQQQQQQQSMQRTSYDNGDSRHCDSCGGDNSSYRYSDYRRPLQYAHDEDEYMQQRQQQEQQAPQLCLPPPPPQQQQQQQPLQHDPMSAVPLPCMSAGFLYATPSAFDAAPSVGASAAALPCDDNAGNDAACLLPRPLPVLPDQQQQQQHLLLPPPPPPPHAQPAPLLYMRADASMAYYAGMPSDYDACYNSQHRRQQHPQPPQQRPQRYGQPMCYTYNTQANNNNGGGDDSLGSGSRHSCSEASSGRPRCRGGDYASYNMSSNGVSYMPMGANASYGYSVDQADHAMNNKSNNSTCSNSNTMAANSVGVPDASVAAVMRQHGDVSYVCACCNGADEGEYEGAIEALHDALPCDAADMRDDVMPRADNTAAAAAADATPLTGCAYTSGSASPAASFVSDVHTYPPQQLRKSGSCRCNSNAVVVTLAQPPSSVTTPARERSCKTSPLYYLPDMAFQQQQQQPSSSSLYAMQRGCVHSGKRAATVGAAPVTVVTAPQPLLPSPPHACEALTAATPMYAQQQQRCQSTSGMYDVACKGTAAWCGNDNTLQLPPAALQTGEYVPPQPHYCDPVPLQQQRATPLTPSAYPHQYRNNPYSMTTAIISSE